MTPFGAKMRELRNARGLTQAQMASALGVSPPYLSALERGQRGRPSWRLVQGVISCLGVIWDDAEEIETLAGLSHPRITIDTSGLSPLATELTNRLSQKVSNLDDATLKKMLNVLESAVPG
ncbi:MAG: helix-turn-helix transcriptional regulator [Proteobacteria bacterium]|nr:helix-turn-helix transcriptional regulator [Pseudomonadota bacterium]